MQISGRNKLPGTVKKIAISGPVAEVIMDCGGHDVAAVVTADSVNELGLKEGDQATALIKATSVMILK
ncbi:MAG: TOBE domain-containing protein [Firmicutes bacterium]|nr:TOBE domain-containing protein [Bacillota bacterium]